jgi:hypothetical protein
MRISRLFVGAALAVLLLPLGCQEEEKASTPPALKQQLAAPTPSGGAVGDAGGAPPMVSSGDAQGMSGGGGPMTSGGGTSGGNSAMKAEDALKIVTTVDTDLVPLQKTMQQTESAYKKSPDDGKLKAAYVEATYTFGHAAMSDGQKDPRIMYRAALALYRRALAVDPSHQPSLDDKNMIESIYKSMGRPVPE